MASKTITCSKCSANVGRDKNWMLYGHTKLCGSCWADIKAKASKIFMTAVSSLEYEIPTTDNATSRDRLLIHLLSEEISRLSANVVAQEK